MRSPSSGGKQAGEGTDGRRRDGASDDPTDSLTTRLTGQKGAGESLTTIEDAEDGSGTSSRAHRAKTRRFRQQVESFVAREDVPEELRRGVREYFESIHQPAGAGADGGGADNR